MRFKDLQKLAAMPDAAPDAAAIPQLLPHASAFLNLGKWRLTLPLLEAMPIEDSAELVFEDDYNGGSPELEEWLVAHYAAYSDYAFKLLAAEQDNEMQPSSVANHQDNYLNRMYLFATKNGYLNLIKAIEETDREKGIGLRKGNAEANTLLNYNIAAFQYVWSSRETQDTLRIYPDYKYKVITTAAQKDQRGNFSYRDFLIAQIGADEFYTQFAMGIKRINRDNIRATVHFRAEDLDALAKLPPNLALTAEDYNSLIREHLWRGNIGQIKLIFEHCLSRDGFSKYQGGTFFGLAVMNGNLEAALYFEPYADRKNPHGDYANHFEACVWASVAQHQAYHIYKALLPRGASPDMLPGDISAIIEDSSISEQTKYQMYGWGKERWQAFGYEDAPSQNLINFSPLGFKAALYNELMPAMDMAAAMEGGGIPEEHAYKLAVLFQDKAQAEKFIDKWAQHGEKTPIHDLLLFGLPKTGEWTPEAWGALAMRLGPPFFKYMQLASQIEAALGHVPTNLDEIKEAIKRVSYDSAAQEPEFALMCFEQGIEERDFERAVRDLLPKLRAKQRDCLPDITIDGAEIGHEGYYLKKLPIGDLRGLLIGAYTNDCTYIGNNGEMCAVAGSTSEYSGFYVIHKRAKKTAPGEFSADDPMVGHSWAWIAEDGGLVLDSLEIRSALSEIGMKFAKCLADKMHKDHALPYVRLGVGGRTPEQEEDGAYPILDGTHTNPKDHPRFVYKDPDTGMMTSDSGVQMELAGETYEAHAALQRSVADIKAAQPQMLVAIQNAPLRQLVIGRGGRG